MPLPNDEKLIALSNDLIQQFDTIFGLNPGFRPAHAKGAMLTGTFTPSSEASSLTRAPHVVRESTPVTVRFSNSTGLPLVPDNDPNANPRGLAIRRIWRDLRWRRFLVHIPRRWRLCRRLSRLHRALRVRVTLA